MSLIISDGQLINSHFTGGDFIFTQILSPNLKCWLKIMCLLKIFYHFLLCASVRERGGIISMTLLIQNIKILVHNINNNNIIIKCVSFVWKYLKSKIVNVNYIIVILFMHICLNKLEIFI